jgi:hypothetical protein
MKQQTVVVSLAIGLYSMMMTVIVVDLLVVVDEMIWNCSLCHLQVHDEEMRDHVLMVRYDIVLATIYYNYKTSSVITVHRDGNDHMRIVYLQQLM